MSATARKGRVGVTEEALYPAVFRLMVGDRYKITWSL